MMSPWFAVGLVALVFGYGRSILIGAEGKYLKVNDSVPV